VKQCLACGGKKPLSEYSCPPAIGKHLAVCKACELARRKRYRNNEHVRNVINARHVQQRVAIERQGETPKCLRCGTPEPLRSSAMRILEWRHWGHRCPHGEPCPGSSAAPEGVKTCARCAPQPATREACA
jgi:hypothetical protein